MTPAIQVTELCKQALVQAGAPFASAPSSKIIIEDANFIPLASLEELYVIVVRYEDVVYELDAVRDPRTRRFTRGTCTPRH